ncbi:MAG TPA: hypothetical protein VJT70_09405 [Sphingomicrobium sp.]|nr:hypothetical protein [Sphingomicrobium sp.]
MKWMIAPLALLAAAGCQQETASTSNTGQDEGAPTKIAQPAPTANKAANVTLPDKRTPLAEPKGAIDPKSVEAAGQVVQHYGALIEQGHLAEAAKYWGDADAAAAFARQLQSRGLRHLEIGDLGQPEGAAGSIYVNMPVVFYGGDKRNAADVILRRVNDVPGSTEAQRRWHIERIEWNG